jgi:hypothetical protein
MEEYSFGFMDCSAEMVKPFVLIILYILWCSLSDALKMPNLIANTKTSYISAASSSGLRDFNANAQGKLRQSFLDVPCLIKVIGVGGGGSNAVNRMVDCSPARKGIEFWAVNTDAQALFKSPVRNKLVIGQSTAR